MTPEGLNRLKLDEGLQLVAYPDPKTKGPPWTIGYGCTGPNITKDTTWTQGQANAALLSRVALIEIRLKKQLSLFSQLSPVRQDVLVNIAYNIGITGLLSWHDTLAALAQTSYLSAAEDIRDNNVWKNEVGLRVNRCADALVKDSW